MEASAKMLPENTNIKLILRHSFRPSLHNSPNHEDVRLTPDGIRSAKEFGRSIEFKIGELHSSIVPRCVETIQSIMTFRDEKRNIILSKNILSDVFAIDRTKADISFKTIGSLKKIVFLLKNKITPSGFRDIDDIISMILDYIFLSSSKNSLDIYCTHDLQLALLYSVLFADQPSIKDIESEWPNMLEGMFFYGQRSDFVCIWRTRVKRFQNFYLKDFEQ